MDRYSWFLQWIDLFDRRHTWRALATQLPRKNLKNLGFFVTSFDESENSSLSFGCDSSNSNDTYKVIMFDYSSD
jgi:hypothetical protein